jgi:acylphosphatase
MSEPAACLHAIVEGRVQGVGFRVFVSEQARTLGLCGWVRNKGEDQVEVWAEGPHQQLELLLEILHKGPRSAYVSAVQSSWPDPSGEYGRFTVISSTW